MGFEFKPETKEYKTQKYGNAYISVGGNDPSLVAPSAKLSWNCESQAEVGFLDIEFGIKDRFTEYGLNNNIIQIEAGGFKHFWKQHSISEFEWDIELTKKPGSNVFTWKLNYSSNLNFYYQPELTLAEISEGCVRPERVVGSYAVYGNKKGKFPGINYATGKLCHIFRPLCIDNIGIKAWCDLHIDTNSKTMSVTIPQDFLNNASYPVILDPNLGLSTQGGTALNNIAGSNQACHVTPGEDGTGVNIHAWVGTTGGTGSANWNMCMYDDDTGNNRPENQLSVEVQGSITLGNTAAIRTIAYTPSITNGTKYWLAFWPEHYRIEIYYDTGATNQGIYRTGIGDLPDPWADAGTNVSREYSFYLEYSTDEPSGNSLWYFNMLKTRNS